MSQPNRMMPRRGIRAILALTTAGLITVAAGISPAMATPTVEPVAAPPAVTAQTGWARIAHLSADTKTVDVRVTALKGGSLTYELNDVAYGMVSDYRALPAGTYVISMVPSGSSTTKAMISASVKIEQGKTVTVAAYGKNSDLQTRVFTDDLTAPEAGAARIRLIQASSKTASVDVRTTTGLLIADDAATGSSTSYASVPAGPWNLELTAKGLDNAAVVELPNGSVNTLFVLDNARGGLTVMSVLDSASVGAAPVGGVQTGGGYLKTTFSDLPAGAV